MLGGEVDRRGRGGGRTMEWVRFVVLLLAAYMVYSSTTAMHEALQSAERVLRQVHGEMSKGEESNEVHELATRVLKLEQSVQQMGTTVQEKIEASLAAAEKAATHSAGDQQEASTKLAHDVTLSSEATRKVVEEMRAASESELAGMKTAISGLSDAIAKLAAAGASHTVTPPAVHIPKPSGSAPGRGTEGTAAEGAAAADASAATAADAPAEGAALRQAPPAEGADAAEADAAGEDHSPDAASDASAPAARADSAGSAAGSE